MHEGMGTSFHYQCIIHAYSGQDRTAGDGWEVSLSPYSTLMFMFAVEQSAGNRSRGVKY